VDEDLDFDLAPCGDIGISAILADAEFAGEVDAADSLVPPEQYARRVGRICLGAEMDGDVRGMPAREEEHPGVRDNQGVHAQVLEIFQVGRHLLQVRLPGENVYRDVYLSACRRA